MGNDTGSSSAGEGGGHLVYGEHAPPVSAWAVETNDAFALTRAGCLEPLVQYGYDGSLSEKLATSWEQVEPTVWEFQLREGVQFQDGSPMDADAVVGALTHVLEAKTPARSFNPSVVSGVEAVDESTIRITTKQPDVLLAYRMASPNTGILAPKAYAGSQIDVEGTCTGPFEAVEEVEGQSLSLERNENYWGGTPVLATAEVGYLLDGDVRATQLQTGEVDIAQALPVVSMADLEGNENLEVTATEIPRTTAMLLNNSRPPFDDPLVRQAIQSSIDKGVQWRLWCPALRRQGASMGASEKGGDGLDLDGGAVVELGDAGDGAGWAVVADPVGVDGVEGGPLVDVGDVDGDRDEVGPVRAGLREAVVEVLENLSCLGLERLVGQRRSLLVDRQLAGQVSEVSVNRDVRVVATGLDQGGTVVKVDGGAGLGERLLCAGVGHLGP